MPTNLSPLGTWAFTSIPRLQSRLADGTSHPPTSTEELRDKYVIMSNMWLLAQMRQPGRHLYADLLSELLSTRNFRFRARSVEGVKLVVPQWSHCLEYEFQIRSNSSSLSGLTALNMNFKFGKRLSLLRAPEAYRFNPHCGPFTVTNTTGWSTGSRSLRLPTLHRPCLYPPAVASQMAAMQKRMTALENRDRSRTPAPRQSAKAATQQSANSKGQSKGKKPKGSKGEGKSSASANPRTAGFKKFHIIKGIPAVSAHFDPRDGQQPGICYNFNSNKACPTTPCPRLHVCISCGKVATPYDNCGCLERYT